MNTNNLFLSGVTFDDVIFANRNHAYGAYYLRKKYNTFLILAFITSFALVISPIMVSKLIATLYPKKVEITGGGTIIFTPTTPIEPTPPTPSGPPLPKLPNLHFGVPTINDSTYETEPFPPLLDDFPKADVTSGDFNGFVPYIDDAVDEDNNPHLIVQEPATFAGGDLLSFRNWLTQQIKYPDEATRMGLSGKVIVQFVVGKTGNIEDVKLLRKVDPLLDNEAVRVLLLSPKWQPAKQGGVVVRQQFALPVSFSITQ